MSFELDREGNLHICKEEIIAAFSKALTILFENDIKLFEYDVQERAIAARLAMYLREIFLDIEKYNITIDVEYNRDDGDVKRRYLEDKDGWIASDIILHERGSGGFNYKNDIFYCEIKKKSHSENDDAQKVKEQMTERKYQYGINLYYLQENIAYLDLYWFDKNSQNEENAEPQKVSYHYELLSNALVCNDKI